MFDFLSHKIASVFSGLSKNTTISEDHIKQTLEKVSDALLEADVPFDVTIAFVDSVKKEVVGKKLIGSLKPGEHLVKVVHDSLLAFFGGKQAVEFSFQLPAVVMVMGLQGSGKTTTCAKLAHYVQKQAGRRGKKRSILMASVDFYRPAAIDQLEQLSLQANASFYRAKSTNPVEAAKEIYAEFKNNGYELLFLDTAGRLHVDNQMLQELRDIDAHLSPRYKILALDAMTGQESLAVAQAFDSGVGFGSAILTKMDSDTRGGAAFSFRYSLKKPIIFVGVGEKVDSLEQFYPERAASRILGMGDLQTLFEHAEDKIKESEQEDMQKAMLSGHMTLDDFAQQMDMMNRIGSLSTIMKYMPGMGDVRISQEELHKGEGDLKRFRSIISSMTSKERINPSILDVSRKKRVALGAGVQISDVNTLIARFEQAQQYVKLLKKSGPLKRLFR
ncbi:MAG: signal recognition particle protein [Candidatus Dependentiae bacterium]|nr:signal recognition particle protein [Candidatus Dependentiae bacterium]